MNYLLAPNGSFQFFGRYIFTTNERDPLFHLWCAHRSPRYDIFNATSPLGKRPMHGTWSCFYLSCVFSTETERVLGAHCQLGSSIKKGQRRSAFIIVPFISQQKFQAPQQTHGEKTRKKRPILLRRPSKADKTCSLGENNIRLNFCI